MKTPTDTNIKDASNKGSNLKVGLEIEKDFDELFEEIKRRNDPRTRTKLIDNYVAATKVKYSLISPNFVENPNNPLLKEDEKKYYLEFNVSGDKIALDVDIKEGLSKLQFKINKEKTTFLGTGVIQIARLDDKFNIVPGKFDLLKIKDGEITGAIWCFPEPTKENSRIFDLMKPFIEQQKLLKNEENKRSALSV